MQQPRNFTVWMNPGPYPIPSLSPLMNALIQLFPADRLLQLRSQILLLFPRYFLSKGSFYLIYYTGTRRKYFGEANLKKN